MSSRNKAFLTFLGVFLCVFIVLVTMTPPINTVAAASHDGSMHFLGRGAVRVYEETEEEKLIKVMVSDDLVNMNVFCIVRKNNLASFPEEYPIEISMVDPANPYGMREPSVFDKRCSILDNGSLFLYIEYSFHQQDAIVLRCSHFEVELEYETNQDII